MYDPLYRIIFSKNRHVHFLLAYAFRAYSKTKRMQQRIPVSLDC